MDFDNTFKSTSLIQEVQTVRALPMLLFKSRKSIH